MSCTSLVVQRALSDFVVADGPALLKCHVRCDYARYSSRSVCSSCPECIASDAWSVVFRTDWNAIYVLEIGAFQAEPIVEVVFVGPLVSGFEFGAAH